MTRSNGAAQESTPAPRIHVMHVVDTLRTGGLERGVVNLIQRLPTDRFRHTICAIRSLGPLAAQLEGRAEVSCLFHQPGRFSVVAGELARRIAEASPQVVHARNWGTIEGVWAARWARTPGVVYSEHGTEQTDGGAEPRMKRWLRRLAYESAHQVFSVSYQWRAACAERTGFPSERIGVIHNGVDTQRYGPDNAVRAEVRRELGLAGEETCIGAVGRLEPVKDLATLLRAGGRLGTGRPWRIVVVGEGSQQAALRAMVAGQPSLASRVQFLGETGEVARLLKAMDIYVLPSISEGISNSLLEAMATGVPAIATATGGNPEVIADGESGLLFPVGADERLAELLEQWITFPDRRKGWGERARQRALEHFSIDSMVARYDEMYSRLSAVPPVRQGS